MATFVKNLILCVVLGLVAAACRTDFSDTFTKYDTDHDGEWTHEEYWAAEGSRYGERGWREMDVNGSGTISRFEYYRYPNSVRNN